MKSDVSRVVKPASGEVEPASLARIDALNEACVPTL